jgi:hypothetical protein
VGLGLLRRRTRKVGQIAKCGESFAIVGHRVLRGYYLSIVICYSTSESNPTSEVSRVVSPYSLNSPVI